MKKMFRKITASLTAAACLAGLTAAFPQIMMPASAAEVVSNDFEVNYGGWHGTNTDTELTAYENIALALSIQKRPAKDIDKAVKNVAEQLGITDVLGKYPYEMSGGQKQRVASARAIVTEPKLVLADEPTGALDSKSSKMLLERFNYLNREHNATIIMVTHDSFTASYASRVLFIKDGKLFNEIIRGNDSRRQFFDKIINVVTLLGGDVSDAL